MMSAAPCIALLHPNTDVCAAFAAVLQDAGFGVVMPPPSCGTATNELLALLDQEHVDVLLVDVSYPSCEDWSAFQTAQATVRAHGRRLVVTTTDPVGLQTRGNLLPNTVWLALPCGLDELTAAVEQARALVRGA
jgi:hypothetical protein